MTGDSAPSPAAPKPRRMTAPRRVGLIIGCIVALLILYVLLDHYTPSTSDAYVQAYVVQIAPQVEGRVVRVAVENAQAVRKEQLLFEIDPRPYRYEVEGLEAELVETRQDVKVLTLQYEAAVEDAKAAASTFDFYKQEYEKIKEIYEAGAATFREFIEATDNFRQYEALLREAEADAEVAEAARKMDRSKDPAALWARYAR